MESKKGTLEKTIQLFDSGCLEFTTNIFTKKSYTTCHTSTTTVIDNLVKDISERIIYEIDQKLSEITDIEKPISIKISYDCQLLQ